MTFGILHFVLCLLDFTNNRYDHIPQEVCDFMQLVKLSFYRNLLRSVPEDLRHLENLKDLNLRYNTTTCTYTSLMGEKDGSLLTLE